MRRWTRGSPFPSSCSSRNSGLPLNAVTAIPEHLEAFARTTSQLTWPNWMACDRNRGTERDEETDRFRCNTMRADNRIEHQRESR
ncbi:hypothetical protein BDW02DRAFT_327787 [Decorospora gaudefroyi]|uniref:Uncharacterized protein n=1 Tax=Decorospora gaudefroyi TaxID=184978 RepID=A0A6A5KE96_9PLEO|nr:hypothetical protein BDW02DRAFT_327787 [Decorospora gaudefroyi]